MKLKTLKGFFDELREHNKDNTLILAFIDGIEERQRQLAIKWIKFYEKTKDGLLFTKGIAIRDWLKHFFNITEDLLK